MKFQEFLIGHKVAEDLICLEAADKAPIRTHISHLEDMIINDGKSGGQKSIDFIKGFLEDYHQKDSFVVTKKVDGAPAVVFGIDPTTKKFFVSTKSAFNKSPRVFYSTTEIRSFYLDKSADLMNKLIACFDNLKNVVKTGMYQGDLLFAESKDIKHQKIDGKDYLTFRPNTIVYAIEPNSEYGKAIVRANIGIVVHTKLTGKLGELTPVYDISIDVFKKDKNVFLIGNRIKDMSEELHLNDHDKKALNGYIRTASEHLNQIDNSLFDLLNKEPSIKAQLIKFINTQVANGDFVAATSQYLNKFHKYVNDAHEEKMASLKQTRHKENATTKKDLIMDPIMDSQISLLFAFMEQIAEAKKIIIHQLSEIDGISSYINDNGWEKISGEGLVVVDAIGHDVVKFVDRLKFSKANFNLTNDWRT